MSSQLQRDSHLSDRPPLRVGPQSGDDAASEIARGATASQSFFLMNLFAAIVASYGLLANSPAVVIGAMVIATLLAPIAGIGLALVSGDRSLFWRSALTVLAGVAEVLLVSYAIGTVHSSLPITTEILSRTKPNLLDLMIAVAGGAAGAYAVGRRVPGGTMIGVAIATALVPPLASVGLAASHGYWLQARGAMLLFITNFIAIQCAYSIVLYFLRVVAIRDKEAVGHMVRRLAPSLVLLLALAVTLGYILNQQIHEERRSAMIRHALDTALAATPGAYLADMSYHESDTAMAIVASIRVPTPISPSHILRLEAWLGARLGKPITLTVRSYLMRVADNRGYLFEPEQVKTVVDRPELVTVSPDTLWMLDSLRIADSLNTADSLNAADSAKAADSASSLDSIGADSGDTARVRGEASHARHRPVSGKLSRRRGREAARVNGN